MLSDQHSGEICAGIGPPGRYEGHPYRKEAHVVDTLSLVYGKLSGHEYE